MTNVKIAIGQMPVTGSLKKNLATAIGYIETASKNKANILCLPESCLGDTPIETTSKELSVLKSLCKEKRIYCIIGAHTKENKRIYNSAIMINYSGNVDYIYHKNHLFPGLDLKTTTPGKGNKVIKTKFGKIATIICWDFAFPQEAQRLSKKGAQIIFCPSYLLNEAEVPKEILRSYPLIRAFENGVYFATCDAYTSEVLKESFICSPLKVIKTIKNKKGIIYANLNLNYLNKIK